MWAWPSEETIIPETMRAAVFHGPVRVEIQHLAGPRLGPGVVPLGVLAATTCGPDVKTFLRGHPEFPSVHLRA